MARTLTKKDVDNNDIKDNNTKGVYDQSPSAFVHSLQLTDRFCWSDRQFGCHNKLSRKL
jgi:hypothetical protein